MSNTRVKTAEFLISNTDPAKCPAPDKPEYAFIGRSNVGKSSLINMLTGFKSLAKTSSTPGKTQLINHFLINEQWYLVDLPGYGFAKSSKSNRSKWQKMIRTYLESRENLICTFVLIDSRLEPQKIDLEFVNWLGTKGVPISLIFTKADKQSLNKTQSNIAKFNKELKKTWESIPPEYVTSAETSYGREEVLDFIEVCNLSF
jgi:GTP-binding protein